ncbi:MAG: type II toxin-antitoxin system Phd/YefM family antitoxin [Burkholderiales bacterium]
MPTMTIGEIKARFSDVLKSIQRGETVIVSYGKRREKIAAIIPYSQVAASTPRPLGLLKGKARCRIASDFSVTDEEFLAG